MQNTKLNRDQKILDNKYVICLRNMLGNGAFASVYKGHYSENPEKKIAIKLLNISKYKAKIQENILKNFQREQEIISKLNHPNIVQFIDVCQSDDYYYLILEYCEEGNLKNILDKQPNRRLPFQQAFDVFSGIIHGYEALYRAKVIHRDLKPENIIFNNGIAKIADFGFAKIVDDMDEVNVHTFLGSPLYCAPEILEGKPYDSKADVWSLGCIFYEMLYGGAPFNAAHIQSLVKQAKKGISKFPLEVQVDENALNILKGMIQADTAQRLRWDQIFAHNYFKQYNPSVIFSQANATESQFIQAEIQKKNLEERLTLIDNNLKFQKEINEYLTKVAREAHQVMHWLKMSIENQILLFTSSAMMVFLIMCNLKKLIGGLPQQFEIGISQEDIKVLKEDRIKYNENLNWINSQFQSLAKYKEDLQQRTQQQENKFQPETVQLIKDLLNTKSINAKFIETYNKIIRQCIIEFYQKISSQQSSLLIQTMKSIIKLFYCLYPFKFRINQFEVVLLEGEINIKKENDLRETIEKLIKEYQLIIAH